MSALLRTHARCACSGLESSRGADIQNQKRPEKWRNLCYGLDCQLCVAASLNHGAESSTVFDTKKDRADADADGPGDRGRRGRRDGRGREGMTQMCFERARPERPTELILKKMARGSAPVHSADRRHGIQGGDVQSVRLRPPRHVGHRPGRGRARAEETK